METIRKHSIMAGPTVSDELPWYVTDALSAGSERWKVRALRLRPVVTLGLYSVLFRLVVKNQPELFLADCKLVVNTTTGTRRPHLLAIAYRRVTPVSVVWHFVRRPAISLPEAVLEDAVIEDVRKRFPDATV